MDQLDKRKPGRPRKRLETPGRSSHSVWLTEEARALVIGEAEQKHVSMSEVMAARIDHSYTADRALADQQAKLAAFGDDPHEIAAVKAFAAILRATQRRHSKSWREGDCIPWVVTEATRMLLVSQTRSPLFEGLAPFGRTAEVEAEARVMGEVAQGVFTFPPLPELSPQNDPQNWTGRGRYIVTFKNKASGEIIETVTVYEGEWDKLATMSPAPEYLEAIERLRPRRDEIEVESSFVHVLKSEQSAWDVAPVKPTGPEEAARLMEGQPNAIENRPAELFDRADFDEALNGKPRAGDDGPTKDASSGTGSSGGAASPTPARWRKVKA